MAGNKIASDIPPEKRQRGRPKGARNKTTATAKAIIEETADNLGGAERMTAWAREAPENERAFWTTIYPKLLPIQVANPEGETFKTEETNGAAKVLAALESIAERSGTAGGADTG